MDTAEDFQAVVAALDAVPPDFDPSLWDIMMMCPRCELVRTKTDDDEDRPTTY